MAKKPNAPKATVTAAVTLAMIVAATQAGSFVYADAATFGPLVEAGLAETNPEMSDETGKLATRATQKGIESMNIADQTNTVVLSAAARTNLGGFVLEDAIEVPKIARGGRGGEVYPFEIMGVNQSFFVAATAEKPDPAKSLASTVSSATARFAVETDEAETVKIKVYQMDEASGKRFRDAEGKLVQTGEREETRKKMKETRKFVVRAVEEKGVKGARVWRTA